MENRKKNIRVVAAVIRRENMVFATQRGYGAYKDWWEFPGGKIEPGETPEEALVREIREELNTKIAVDGFLTTVEYEYPEFHLTMDCFWAHIEEGHLTLLEHEAARWLPMDSLGQVRWLPADILVIRAIENDSASVADRTVQYYNRNAAAFYAGSAGADMRECRARFLHYLKPGARILDAGCGSGRDALAFLQAGYETDAFDASSELCAIASEKTGIAVRQDRFETLTGEDIYDGIWACASLLHVRRDDLPEVLRRLRRLLKKDGVLYASFKYGTGERQNGERYFHDLTEDTLTGLLEEAGFEIKEVFVTQDVREGREDEKWVNAIARA